MSESSKSIVKVIRCIVCPTGCEIQVKQDKKGQISFEGYTCKEDWNMQNRNIMNQKEFLPQLCELKMGFYR